ncbi:TadE/TadG family type IV pilus assembly protein [Phenylobacterium sp.]|uniref:TadE/TadG family type IV pilus assembly protein n=1 Tax=Phenylobacterium sp. TaxID=1871053 RepID=UPI0028124132|nr:TadE/TadG family type IV pilus assembly protein [Phenylobacterium sp.]
MTLLRKLRILSRESHGAALVELTLLMPLLVTLMFGLAEFGQVLRQHHLMEKGVRDAARFLTHIDATPCPADAAWTGAVSDAQNLAVFGRTTAREPLLDTWTDPASVVVEVECIDNTAGTWRGGDVVAVVTVTASALYADLGLLGFFGFEPPTLNVSHQQLVVGG